MKERLVVFSILVVSLFGSGKLFGDGFIFIGLQGGWSQQDIDVRDFELDKNTAFLYGARVGVRILMVAVEGNFYKAAHNIEASEIGNLWDSQKLNYHYLGLNVRIFLPLPIVNPYLTVGNGSYTADIQGVGKDKRGGWNAGLGVEAFLGEKFSLLGEARYNYGNFDIEGAEVNVRNFTFNVGINFYF